VPYLLFVVFSLASLAALVLPGQSDWLLLTLPAALAGLWLALRSRTRGRAGRPVIIDGSNVMHWKDGEPGLDPVREVIRQLRAAGYEPGVVFDANAGYKLEGRYLHDGAFGKRLNLARRNVMIVPRNTPADPLILTAARDYGAPVVTCDRFRDWRADFPEIATPGFLIAGRYEGRQLVLDLPA
jgi:hypothetical protein